MKRLAMALVTLPMTGCTDEEGILIFFAVVIGLVIIIGVPMALKSEKQIAETKENVRSANNLGYVAPFGTYAAGHPAIAQPTAVECGANATDLIILDKRSGHRIGRIPLASLVGAEVIDETTVSTKSEFTLARVALLGVLALAFPKNTTQVHVRVFLRVRWSDGAGEQATFFAFPYPDAAREALSFVNTITGASQKYA